MIVIFLIAATAFNLAFLNVLVKKSILVIPRRWAFALTLLNTCIVVLHLATQDTPSTFVWWFFHVNFEFNFGATISSILLLSTGLLALVIAAALRSSLRLRLVWLIWGATYLFLSYDEMYSFHEHVAHWVVYYIMLGIIAVSAALYGGWFADRKHIVLYLLLIIGLGITAAGGVVIEHLPFDLIEMEEYLELTGTILVFSATFTCFRRRLTDVHWQQTRRLLAVGSVTWVVVMIGVTFWPLPVLEARYLAQQSSTEYLDGALTLIAYQIDSSPRQAGEQIRITQYWRANQPLTEHYAQSVRLLHPTTGEALAQVDIPLGPPTLPTTDAWIPGLVFKKTFSLVTDHTLPAPARYWLSLNVWRAPWDEDRDDNMLLISHTEQEMLLPDTLVLGQAVFLSSDDSPNPPELASHQFDNAMQLKGYDFPVIRADEDVSLRFWWKLDANLEEEYIQFLHLHDLESDAVYVLDQPPLPELPTRDWPIGLEAVSEWKNEHLRELPPGQYDLFTGLYELNSVERVGIGDEAALDNRVHLGILVVETPLLPQ